MKKIIHLIGIPVLAELATLGLHFVFVSGLTAGQDIAITGVVFLSVLIIFATKLSGSIAGWRLFGARGVAIALSVAVSFGAVHGLVTAGLDRYNKSTEVYQTRLAALQASQSSVASVAQYADADAAQRAATELQRLATIAAQQPDFPAEMSKYMDRRCNPKKAENGLLYKAKAAELCPQWSATVATTKAEAQQAATEMQRLQQIVDGHGRYLGHVANVANAEIALSRPDLATVAGLTGQLPKDWILGVLLVIIIFIEWSVQAHVNEYRRAVAGIPNESAQLAAATKGMDVEDLKYFVPGYEAARSGAKPNSCPYATTTARQMWKKGFDAGGGATTATAAQQPATDAQQPATIQRATFSATDKSRNGDAPQAIMLPHTMRGDFNMLHAGPGAGKSMLAFGMAYAMATGGEFLKWRSNGSHKVLIVDGEMGEALVKQRIETMGIAHPNIEVLAYDNLPTEDFPYLHTARGQAVIDAHMDGVDVLILDNLGVLTDDAYHSSTEWGKISQWIKAVTARGVAVWLIHHDNKSAQADGRLALSKMLATQYQLQPVDTGGERLVVDIVAKKHRRFFGADAETFRAEFAGGKWVVESGGDKNRVAESSGQIQTPQNNVVKLRQLSALDKAKQADIIAQAFDAAKGEDGREPSYTMICNAAYGLGYAVDKSYLSRNKGLLPTASKAKNKMGFVG